MNLEELRKKTPADLRAELLKLRKEQFALRLQRATGQAVKPDQFGKVRKNIARLKTVQRQVEMAAPVAAKAAPAPQAAAAKAPKVAKASKAPKVAKAAPEAAAIAAAPEAAPKKVKKAAAPKTEKTGKAAGDKA
jgi:large subunit ribosomal protein L29